MTSQQKKTYSIKGIIAFVLFLGITIAAIVLNGQIFGEESVFNQQVSQHAILQTLFQKIPALIRSIQIITFSIIVGYLIQWIISLMMSKNNKGITVAKLLNSFVKWVVGLVALLLVLGAWGVDTATLIASAGIVSLVIGLGAQSLVADIIAGLFIVIEGEYQVGDIVIIDGWRGTVKEIGIRTTKIEDAGGNLKIVNNSEITTLINQTKALSVARATISIEYGESLPRVELVIKDNLDKMRANIPGIIAGPFYKGVTALSASSVDLLFLAECKEEDIYEVQRALNRELKLLFDANNIGIPFPQIVINQPSMFGDKANETQGQIAREFLQEQKELSKDLEEKPEE